MYNQKGGFCKNIDIETFRPSRDVTISGAWLIQVLLEG